MIGADKRGQIFQNAEEKEWEENISGVVGWCEGAGYPSVPGRPTSLDYSRARAYCASSRSG